jgi:hypothetical protein
VNRLESALRRVLKDLDEDGRRAAVVGGLAVSVRSEPRTTRDVDFAVAVDDDQAAEQVVYRLSVRGYQIKAPLEQEAVGRLATVRMTPPGSVGETVVVDLLFASSGIERETEPGSPRSARSSADRVQGAVIGSRRTPSRR